MATIAELVKVEMLARLRALPLTDYGADAPAFAMIRRSHLTVVDRTKAPAVYLRFGKATKSEDKACNWTWELEFTVSVYVRSDDDADADPIVLAVVSRLNPSPPTPYTNLTFLRINEIDAETEVEDADAQRVDVKGIVKYTTRAWDLEARA